MYTSVLLSLATPASACGGFACDAGPVPILQEAERIVFSLDEEAREVEMHVQITYAGEDDDFAWIVPVPQVPELFLTSSVLFDQIQLATQPLFVRQVVQDGRCRTPGGKGDEGRFASDAASSDGYDYDYDDGSVQYDVEVVARDLVGPYETVTLAADSAEDLLGFLQSEGYSLPDMFEELLAPYVSEGAYFVALRLSAGQTGGDLAPLGLRYDADKAMVPVQLTAVSATPDMRMETYIFSQGRAVPESYLHVRVNDAAIDWWNNGANYLDVISEAANEAGGRAFATDYHGASDVVPAVFSGYSDAGMRQASHPTEWASELRRQLLVTPAELFPALEEALGLDPGEGATFWGCPECVPVTPFDPALATDIVVERVLEPLLTAQLLLDRFPYLSRLTSAMDAVEMTVDPVFVVNHDLTSEEVAVQREMTETLKCRGLFKPTVENAQREITLPDGRTIALPSINELAALGMSELEYLEEHADINAAVIEQMGKTGPAEVLVDHTAALAELALSSLGLGCSSGCDTTRSASGLGLALALGVVGLRRRSRTK